MFVTVVFAVLCCLNETQTRISSQGRRKPFQTSRQDPFSAPPHNLWRHAINRGRILLQNCPPTALCKRKQVHSLCIS